MKRKSNNVHQQIASCICNKVQMNHEQFAIPGSCQMRDSQNNHSLSSFKSAEFNKYVSIVHSAKSPRRFQILFILFEKIHWIQNNDKMILKL